MNIENTPNADKPISFPIIEFTLSKRAFLVEQRRELKWVGQDENPDVALEITTSSYRALSADADGGSAVFPLANKRRLSNQTAPTKMEDAVGLEEPSGKSHSSPSTSYGCPS